MVFKIGITGGMGSGKSRCLEYLGHNPRIYTMNLDLFAFKIYKLNPFALNNIANYFGEACVTKDGVDRVRLG